MSKTIPYKGEFLQSQDFPALLRCAHIYAGAATTNDVVLSTQTTYNLASLPAGTVIHDVYSMVDTAFTTSVTLTVGDSDSAAGYFASSDIVPQTPATVFTVSRAAAAAYSTGKQYAAAQNLQLTVGGADVAAGVLHLYVLFSMAYND